MRFGEAMDRYFETVILTKLSIGAQS